MKQTISSNLFETNSSSVHAIVLDDDLSKDFKLPDKMFFGFGYFGWDQGIVDPQDYIYTAAVQLERHDFIDHLKEFLEFENVEYIFQDKSDFKFSSHGIDHVYELNYFIDQLKKDKQLLKSFLVTGQIFTGNDNESTVLPDNYYFYKSN